VVLPPPPPPISDGTDMRSLTVHSRVRGKTLTPSVVSDVTVALRLDGWSDLLWFACGFLPELPPESRAGPSRSVPALVTRRGRVLSG